MAVSLMILGQDFTDISWHKTHGFLSFLPANEVPSGYVKIAIENGQL